MQNLTFKLTSRMASKCFTGLQVCQWTKHEGDSLTMMPMVWRGNVTMVTATASELEMSHTLGQAAAAALVSAGFYDSRPANEIS